MKNLLGILIIVVLVILFLSQVGLSQTQRPVVLTVLGGALPQDSLSNKIYVSDSSATNNLAGYYVTPWMYTNPAGSYTYSGATPFALTGTVTKGINFAGVTPSFTDADNAWIAMGTWNDALTISSQTEHFVPLQVHLTSNTSIAKDIAAARFKVTTAVANTLTNVNVLELRSDIGHNIGSATGLSMSTNISGNTTTGAIGLLGGYFSFSGAGNVTSSTSAPAVLLATSTATGTGITNVGQFTVNAATNGVTNVLKAEAIQGTATTLIDGTNTGGTVTNGLKLTGTMTNYINTPMFFVDKVNGTTRVTVGGTAGTAAGNFYADTAMIGFLKPATKMAGIDSFATTAVRKAVSIPGATTGDIYFIQSRLNYAQGSPVGATVDSVKICYYAKTDSLIVVRVAASGGQTGLSGSNFSWIRMKGQ